MPGTTTKNRRAATAWRRLGWFAFIWFASLAAWLAFSYGFKALFGL
jgi:hypothetical protein